jgi:hypothetical protein
LNQPGKFQLERNDRRVGQGARFGQTSFVQRRDEWDVRKEVGSVAVYEER